MATGWNTRDDDRKTYDSIEELRADAAWMRQSDAEKYRIEGLNRVAGLIVAWRKSKGFDSPERFDDTTLLLSKLALIHTEVSEAVEEVRKGTVEGFARELADTVIRVLDVAGTMNLDLERVIAEVMVNNEGRPRLHGKRA